MIPELTTLGDELPLEDRRRIDAACDRFEADWRAGGPLDLEAFLETVEGVAESARGHLFRELLALELEFLRERGERPSLGEYRERFPEFQAALDSAATLGALDPDATRAPGSAEPHSGDDQVEVVRVGPDTEEVLRSAGYEVVRELGRGGMGVVYEARQVALNRVVAIKLIRSAEFASEAERLRFRNEAEAVARMDHPNIVPIYEVRRHRGNDFFSMKLVPGAGLDKRLDRYLADPRAAARLAATAAEAIHHAHRRGILHRDLKPANVLVDEAGAPHITDFGLARNIESDADLTQSGVIVGTPSYMSPEQASGIKGGLTTATDVYGLGAVLYAMLAGRSPYSGSGLLETLDRVREEPAAPPSKLNPLVPRDLEVICLKCLEKEPARRYADAQALADDLTRYLAGEPIAARPVRATTRAWMWCRRHPLPAALAASLAVALVGGLAGVSWEWREAARQRDAAEAVSDFLTDDLLAMAAPEAQRDGKDARIGDLLGFAAKTLGGKLGDRPAAAAKVREVLGNSFASLGDTARAAPQLREAVRLDTQLYGPSARPTLRAAARLAAALVAAERDAQVASPAHRDPEAEAVARRTLEAARRALGPEDPTTLAAARTLGTLLRQRKALAEAEPLLRQVLDARRRTLVADHPDTLRSMLDLSLLLRDRGRLAEADALAREYEHGTRCSRGSRHPDNIPALANLATLLAREGKAAEAEEFYRKAADAALAILGPDHPATREAVADLARARAARGATAVK